jgi:hypothetical protein
MAVLLLAACAGPGADEDEAATAAAPTAEATPTPRQYAINQVCPPEEPELDDGYCDFVLDLDRELAVGDYATIVGALTGRQIACATASYPCDEPGQTAEVMLLTRDEEGTEMRVDEVREELSRLFSSFAAGASDDRGTGELQIFAIATGVSEIQDKALVLTGLADDPRSSRIAVMVHVVLHDDDWLITSVHIREEGAETQMRAIEMQQSAGSFWSWQLMETVEMGRE